MKKICFLIYTFIVINLSIEEEQNYCDLNHNCDNCTYCGSINKNYCSCHFYNSFCLDTTTNTTKFYQDFLFNYDGCINNNGYMANVCEESDITLEDGKNKTINFKSTTSTNFLCYYNFQKTEINNKSMVINIKTKANRNPKFYLYYIIYSNNIRKGYKYFSDEIFIHSNYYDIVIIGCDKSRKKY